MLRSRLVVAGILLMVLPLSAQPENGSGRQDPAGESSETGTETAAVRSVFDGYKQALIAGDGVLAAALVDRETLAYFSELKQLALESGSAEIRERPFIDRLLVVTMRHELDPTVLAEMDLEDLLRHAIESGWIAEASIRQLTMGEVSIDGDEARGVARAGTNTLAAPDDTEPLYYRFRRQNGEWRFGFSSLVASLNRLVSDFAKQLGADEDEMIFTLVEALSGRKVLPDVWDSPDDGGIVPEG